MEKKILRRIEALRRKLNRLGATHSLVDSEVVELSQQLDSLLNQYYHLRSYQQLTLW